MVLVGAALNGLAVRVVEASAVGWFRGSVLGVSLFEIAAISVAACLVWQSSEQLPRGRGVAEVVAALLLLVPSSAVSWAVLALYAGHVAVGTRGPVRVGALLFVALALASLWSSVGLKLVALWLTSAEAAMVGWLLAHFKDGVVQVANVVGLPSEHSLIVMSACSTADGVPRALVGLAAVMVLAGGEIGMRRMLVASTLLVAIYATANVIRLTLMAWSWDFYEFGHGPVGAGLFDALTTAAVFGLVLATERR